MARMPVWKAMSSMVLTQTLGVTVESVNRYISDIQQVLTQMAQGHLFVEPQVDYKGDFAMGQHLQFIAGANRNHLGVEIAAGQGYHAVCHALDRPGD